MKYEIYGQPFPAVELTLDNGEGMFTQSGGLAWMDKEVSMETNARGGFMKSLGRLLTGESLFLATYRAEKQDAKVTFSANFPGDIRPFTIDATHEYIAQKGCFLCATEGVEIDTTINKKFSTGLFGGEGFFMQRYHGNGILFAEIDGSVKEIDLLPGQTIKVDTGNLAIFESTVDYSIETVKGFKNILFGGEGLFLTTLTGPGKVWLQTLTAQDMAARLEPYMPKPEVTVNTGSK